MPLHVDACVGGFLLPWLRALGHPIPPFDFSVDVPHPPTIPTNTTQGVASISADIHKYGFAAKGASVILYKSNDIRKYQFLAYASWPGGLFVSPSVLGTRGGGPIAAAWTALVHLGASGYRRETKVAMETAIYIRGKIAEMPELYILGNPHATILAFSSKEMNIFAVADVMVIQFQEMKF